MRLWVKDRKLFPDPRQTAEDGIVAISEDLPLEALLESYSFGIFPWPHKDTPILWFCPEQRGIIEFKDLHVSKSLRKFQKQTAYTITFNTCFEKVISNCAEVRRPGQKDTWITDVIQLQYLKFHKQGYAHSIECWMNGELVGGMYGVYVAGVFSGESMFFTHSNASKLCMIHLVEVLKQNGLSWMDVQMVTENVKALGGKYIDRKQFLSRLEDAKLSAKPLVFPSVILGSHQ
jgi:leucyl/phenylalanyl-tRNA--protein transferase